MNAALKHTIQIAGGFITQDIGYQWVFRIISIAAGIAGVFGIFILQETYHPILRCVMPFHSWSLLSLNWSSKQEAIRVS